MNSAGMTDGLIFQSLSMILARSRASMGFVSFPSSLPTFSRRCRRRLRYREFSVDICSGFLSGSAAAAAHSMWHHLGFGARDGQDAMHARRAAGCATHVAEELLRVPSVLFRMQRSGKWVTAAAK